MHTNIKTEFSFLGIQFSYITQNDLLDLSNMLAKETVCEHVFFGPNTEEDTKAYFQPIIDLTAESLSHRQLPEQHVFIIRNKNMIIGNCAIISIPFSQGNYHIGYNIDEPYWRKGYGDITCKFLINYGLNILNARRLTGECMGSNVGSRKIMEINGFVLEGCQRGYWFKNGKFQDNLLFGLLSETK